MNLNDKIEWSPDKCYDGKDFNAVSLDEQALTPKIKNKIEKMNNNELQEKVLDWASSKSLLSRDNVLTQFAKVVSEIGELGDALIKKDTAEIIDALGDCQVTLIILCDQLDLNYDDCLESAYNVIKNRQGRTINGTFLKDE